VNATAILSSPSILAQGRGDLRSIFAGRVADEGNDPAVVIRNVRNWVTSGNSRSNHRGKHPQRHRHPERGSCRCTHHYHSAAIPAQDVDHKYTRETVRQFVQDAEKTMEQMRKGKAAVAGSTAL